MLTEVKYADKMLQILELALLMKDDMQFSIDIYSGGKKLNF